MPKPILTISIALATLAAFLLGYGTATHRGRSVETPTRAVRDAAIPPGIAVDLHVALVSPDPFDRAKRVAELLPPLGPDALGDVRAAYEGVVLGNGDVELVLLAEWWARFDPVAAFAWVHGDRIGRHPAAAAAVIRAWARHDPEAARDAMMTLEAGPLRLASLVALVRGWEESGRGGLPEFLATTPRDDPDSNVAIDALVRGVLQREGRDAAMAWADSLPALAAGVDERFGDRVLVRLARILGQLDPELAAKWVEQHLEGPNRKVLLFRVGIAWGAVDGEAAMTWLGSLPRDPDLTNLAVQETYRTWFIRDPDAASTWIEKQNLEPWLDPAAESHAKLRGNKEPEYGLEWAARIGDSKRRQSATAKIVVNWLLEAPDAGRAWLDHANLDDATRAAIDAMAARYAEARGRNQQRARQTAIRAAGADGAAGEGVARPEP